MFSISGAPGMFDVMIRPDGPWIEGVEKKEQGLASGAVGQRSQGQERSRRTQDFCRKTEVAAWAMGKEGDLDFPHEKVASGSSVLAPRLAAGRCFRL